MRRKVIYHLYKLPQVTINNEKVLLKDEQVFHIGEIEIRCFHVPGHTWGHMVYLIDGKYLFTGDTIWFGADGGYSFISALAEDNKLAVRSLAELEARLKKLGVKPLFITGHTAGRITLISLLPTKTGFVRRLESACMTPARPTTHTTRRTTRKRKRRPDG